MNNAFNESVDAECLVAVKADMELLLQDFFALLTICLHQSILQVYLVNGMVSLIETLLLNKQLEAQQH